MDNSSLYEAIVSFFLQHQRAPKVAEVAAPTTCVARADQRKWWGLRSTAPGLARLHTNWRSDAWMTVADVG